MDGAAHFYDSREEYLTRQFLEDPSVYSEVARRDKVQVPIERG